jgi:hypothetical protein
MKTKQYESANCRKDVNYISPSFTNPENMVGCDRKTYVFYLDTPEFEYEIHDFRPGCSHGVQDCFEDMMAFFQIEEYTYNLREGTEETDECHQMAG